jgi:hypothetical protein
MYPHFILTCSTAQSGHDDDISVTSDGSAPAVTRGRGEERKKERKKERKSKTTIISDLR